MSFVHKPGCWIDVFELSRYRGRRRRLCGPVMFAAIRSRLPDWGISIDSLIVGPAAYVRLFSAQEPGRTMMWLGPHQAVGEFDGHAIADHFDSVEIVEDPPQSGDPQFELFKTMCPNTKTHE